jgi:methyl-accepting chemotaxis protein
MRVQADQTAKAMNEQSRAMRDMTSAASNTASQIKTITQANRGHSQSVAAVLGEVAEARRFTERHAGSLRETRSGTADLVRDAAALNSAVDALAKTSH